MRKTNLFTWLLGCILGAALAFTAQPAFASEFIQLISPNGGERWAPGSSQTIQWQTVSDGTIDLFYSLDSGATWTEIASGDTIPDTGSYQWTVPNITSSKARIKIHWFTVIEDEVDMGILGSYTIAMPYEEEVSSAADFSIASGLIISPIIIKPLPLLVFPDAPTELTAEAKSADEIELSWQDNDDGETGYYLERKKESGGTYSRIDTLDADSDSYTDDDLDANTTYYYRVQAVNGSVTSIFSNVAGAKTFAVLVPIDPIPVIPLPDDDDSSDDSSPAAVVIKLYIGSTEYYVNGELETMDAGPMLYQGRTLLPVRYVADPLGAEVGWKAAEQKATVQLAGKTINMWINSNTAQINGSDVKIDPANDRVTPITVPPGRTMLPIRFISDNLGCKVEWNPALQEVTITYPAP